MEQLFQCWVNVIDTLRVGVDIALPQLRLLNILTFLNYFVSCSFTHTANLPYFPLQNNS